MSRAPLPFGKFLLLDRISVGGMAEVFFAKVFGEDGDQRILALKKILPAMVQDPDFIGMFIDEARIAVQLDHPHIVQIFELGQFAEHYYIAMEYVPGRDLRAVIERAKKKAIAAKGAPSSSQPPALDLPLLDLTAACRIALQLANGLDYAHRAKDAQGRELLIVHRDVSPQNILIGFDGALKLIDFGIAKASSRQQHTQAGILKGKFGYMSPEQVRGRSVDRRSDIFALGVICYELFTGNRLFTGTSDFSVLERVRRAEIPLPRSVAPELPEPLERLLLKALARDPNLRYQWASEFAEDLAAATPAANPADPLPLVQLMAALFSEERRADQARLARFAALPRPAEVAVTSLRHFSATERAGRSDRWWAPTSVAGDFDAHPTGPVTDGRAGATEVERDRGIGGFGSLTAGPPPNAEIPQTGATAIRLDPFPLEANSPPPATSVTVFAAKNEAITTDALRPALVVGRPESSTLRRSFPRRRVWLAASAVATVLVSGLVWMAHRAERVLVPLPPPHQAVALGSPPPSVVPEPAPEAAPAPAAPSKAVARRGSPQPAPRHKKTIAERGALAISASQAALVFLDGKSTRRYTPIEEASPLELPSGSHVVHLETLDQKQADVRVNIRPHSLQHLSGVELR